jgi:hypothetical protein
MGMSKVMLGLLHVFGLSLEQECRVETQPFHWNRGIEATMPVERDDTHISKQSFGYKAAVSQLETRVVQESFLTKEALPRPAYYDKDLVHRFNSLPLPLS